MHLCDMKKITVIASLLILFTACEKAEIRPNTRTSESTLEVKRSANPNVNSGGDGSSSVNSTTNPTVDPGTSNPTDPAGGEITDPLRKKDQKDNK
ncbi:hypothetical protein D3C71_1182810 [compost metagenome]